MGHLVYSILTDYQIVVSIIFAVTAYKWGDWKHWRDYYPTILFFIVGDFSYNILTYNYPLWSYESPLLKTTFSDMLIAFVFFPSTILLYLPHFPKGLKKQILYVLLWITAYTAIERISFSLGFFSYDHGWNIYWSILFNCFMFPLLMLHHKKPYWVWLASSIIATSVIIYFKVPFSSMK
jgi:hypothetical protein